MATSSVRIIGVSILAGLLSVACGGPAKNRCPDSPAQTCLTKKECVWDHERKCEMCRCAAPAYAPPERALQRTPVDEP